MLFTFNIFSYAFIIDFYFDTLQDVAKNGANDSDIVSVTFFDKKGKPLTVQAAQAEDMEIEIIKEKITFEKEPVGFVEVAMSFEYLNNKMAATSSRIEKLVREARQANMEAGLADGAEVKLK